MNRRGLRVLPIAVIVATVALLLAPASAPAAPAAPIDDKRAEAANLEQQITENGRRLGALNEQINGARIALDAANSAINTADELVAAAEAKTRELRSELARRAATVYRGAASSGGVAMLDAKNAAELAMRQKYTSLAAQREKQIVHQLARAKEELSARRADAEQARAAAKAREQEIEAARNELAAGDDKQRALLAQVKGDIADLVAKAEAERRAREEAEARARMAATQLTATRASSAGADTTPRSIPAPSPGAATAIAYAQAQLGKPYCYAGVGPNCFDCSGLTMMAWGAAGVGMPHGSTEQYNMFPRVPMSQAQPGDLVVWNGHVGLYIGGGMMIHAPHSGTVVQIAPVYGTPWGTVRPG